MLEHGLKYLQVLQHLVALVLLALFGARLARNLRFLRWARRQAAQPVTSLPRVSVLIPARNEAATISACVASLLDQEFPDTEVIVLDDGSTDGTGQQLDALSARYPRLKVFHTTGDPPAGWTGKCYACQRLAEQATGDWLLFTDADTIHASQSIMQGITLATRLDASLVSAFPYQQAKTWSERILVSFIIDFLPLIASDFEAMWRGTGGRIVANGQYMLAHAARYRETGGHAAIRGEPIDDFALARQFRARGYIIALVEGTSMLSCRMYRTSGQVWDGFSKNLLGAPALSAQSGHSVWWAPLFAWCYACLFVIPFFQVMFGARKMLAGVEIAGLYLLRALTGWHLRRPPDEIITTPLAAWSVMALCTGTLYRRWRKRPIAWKGRRY
ncbi:MAG TPA: glycosyltransferase [Ktedonobacterales bacterium]|nr:glycosyltransferase [Ktedonobacterales bacterium]